jgi:hypothetical protein
MIRTITLTGGAATKHTSRCTAKSAWRAPSEQIPDSGGVVAGHD